MAGRPPKEKSFANMLRIAVMNAGKSGEPKLREIAEVLVDSAVEGKMDAIKEVADRIDGKVPQAVVGDDEHDPISFVAEIRRTIVRPGS